MDDVSDFKLWLKQLECPESYTSDHTIQRLQTGVLGLIWEDVPKTIRPFSEVSEVRKNILLYKILHEPKDPLIQSIRSTVQLREERKKLDEKIKSREEKWRQQEFLCRQKVSILKRKKEERKILKTKSDIIRIKLEEMQAQIKNCEKMQEICNHLMPPTIEDVSQSTIMNCLSLVSNYSSSGPDKRRIYNQIEELLSPIKIEACWNALLAAKSYYTDYLISIDIEECNENINNKKTNVDDGVAKICSEHLHNVSMRHIYNGRKKTNEKTIITYVQKIDQIIENQSPYLNDWLPLALEVRKLEVLQIELQKELEKLKENLPIDSLMVDDVIKQLTSEIITMDNKTADCVREIKNAFSSLKTTRALITSMKETLIQEQDKLQIIRTNEENNWLDIDLSSELVIFYNNIDINALRKIVVKSGNGFYKHLRTCFNKAFMAADTRSRHSNLSNLPILRMPIYYLVDLYKMSIINAELSKHINEEDLIQDDSDELSENSQNIVMSTNGIMQLLRLTDGRCTKTLQNCEEFEHILKIWSNQTVNEVVFKIFNDTLVYGATLDQWQKRFNMVVYVLQKSNINVV